MYAGTGISIGTIREALPAGAIDHVVLVTKKHFAFLLARAEGACQQKQ